MFAVELQLDWLPNAQFAGILYAQCEGWYRQAGIDLTILDWTPYTNQVDALASDRTLRINTEDNLLIRARSKGAPVKAIGVMMQFSGIGWMALADSGIQSIPDLRGKRLGIHPDGGGVNAPAEHAYQIWREEFDGVRYYGGLFSTTFHPNLLGRPARLRMLHRLFSYMKSFDDVWWATYAEIAAYVKA